MAEPSAVFRELTEPSARSKRTAAQQRKPPQPLEQMQVFVQKHSLVCFKCKTRDHLPARTGWTSKKGRRPWMICTNCIGKRTESNRTSES